MIAKALRKLSGNNAGMVRDYLSLFSGSAGRLVVSLVYFIALANTLPTGDFGIFATASGTGVVLSRLVSLGFSSPLYRISTVKPRLLGIYTAGFLVALLVSLPLFALASWLVYFVFSAATFPFCLLRLWCLPRLCSGARRKSSLSSITACAGSAYRQDW